MAFNVNVDAQQKKAAGKMKEMRADEEDKKQKTQKISESAKPILEEQALLRERLKTAPAWKKDSLTKKKLQPVVGKLKCKNVHGNIFFMTQLWESREARVKRKVPLSKVVRPPSPNFNSGASNVAAKPNSYASAAQQNLHPSSPPHRRKTPSGSPSGSPGPSTPRSASPTLLFDLQMATENQQRVEKAMKVRLYLLQQTGPNSFLIGGDSPNHKFRVMIGPQTCSCSKGPFCVHLLFIMLRVFKVRDNDPLLWEKQLKNYEVEMLFHKFHASVSSRIGSKNKLSRSRTSPRRGPGSPSSSGTPLAGPVLLSGLSQRSDEEVQCPICLLDMVDGESLTICDGCNNSLHQHCMAIWAGECKRQKEALVCPLCRKVWAVTKNKTVENEEKRSNSSRSSPPSPPVQVDAIPLDQDCILPYADPIPAEQVEMSRPWVELFGENLVSCLFSREWNCREKALLHLCKDVKHYLNNEYLNTFPENLVAVCSQIIAMLCADPVYRVYIQAVRAFRIVLAFLRYRSPAEHCFMQKVFSPILDAILIKCADSNRRVSALSVKTLLEVSKDEGGDMAVGSALATRDSTQSLGGLNYVLSRTLVRSPEDITWSWWLGRLYLLMKLLEDLPDHFRIDTETVDYKKVASSVKLPAAPNKLPEKTNCWENNFLRLMFIVHFSIKAVDCPHSTGNKLALRILTRCLRLAVKVRSVYSEVKACLSVMKKSDRSTLQRQLKHYSNRQKAPPHRGVSVDSAYSSTSETCAGGDGQTKPATSSSLTHASTLDGIPDLSADMDVSELDNFQAMMESIADGNDSNFPLTPPTSPSREVERRADTLSPCLPPIDVPLTTTKCQKKIEEEEAEALAIALEASTMQPLVPPPIEKLVADNNEEIVIRVQPELSEDNADGDTSKHVYLESVHWSKTELLGTGAFSSCYAARDKASGTLMAVKQVSFCRNSSDEQKKVIDTILEEISIMSRVQHPNLTCCLGVTKHAGHFNIFLEWMAGGSLAKLLCTHGALEEKVAINYTQQIIRGVAYLHEHHVIHRDIKGANILLDSTGLVVKVADFGAVARLKTEKTFSGEFQGQLLGTIAFMAPEVLRGESYGRKCDVWSMGCVVIEMMTGKSPWNAEQHSNHLALIFKIACSNTPPEIPEGLNPAFRDLILRCLDTNPEERSPALELLKHPVFTRIKT